MTEDEIPTVAYCYKTLNSEGEEVWATNMLDPERGEIQVVEKNELVRRKDVEQLIITVQNQYSNNQEWNDNSEKQAIVDSLIEQLLEEIEE